MLKLMIVDDNDFERNALANYVNWEILGIQLVDTAFNGQDAVDKARAHSPEIIITDVKMPVMDGIEMAKTIKSFHPEVKFIFSSGYDDIALLKEALEIRAFNYILKPINPDELVKTVKTVVSVIIDEKLSNLENNSIIKQYTDNLTFLQSKFFESLILKQQSSEEISELFSQANNLKLRIMGNYMLVLMDLDFAHDDIFDMSCRTDAVICELRSVCENENVIFLEIEHNKIAAIMYCLNDNSSKSEKIISAITDKLRSAKNESRFNFTIGVSETAAELTDLYRLFKHCQAAVNKKIELGYEHVIYYEQLESRLASPKGVNRDSLKELIAETAAKVFEGSDFNDGIGRITDLLTTMPGSKLENTKSAFISLFNFISRQMENNGESFEKVAGDDIDICSYIISAKIIPDILQYVNQTLNTISSYYIRNKTSKDDYVVEEILNILNNEYSNSITLTYLSDRVYLSPNYLRILFKNKMNVSIQDYLTNIRIGKAKELLKQVCYKVHEVGEMVGYPNSTYFNIVFKNYVNLTPGEYRNKFLTTEAGRNNK